MVTPIAPRLSSVRPGRDPALFHPGRIALSRGAYAALVLADCSPRWLVRRHIRGDWGFLHGEEAYNNAWALTHAAPVHSVFELPTGARLLLFTEGTRAVTSILLADTESLSPAAWTVRDVAVRLSPAGLPVAPPAAQPTPPATASSRCPPVFHGPASLADILPQAALAACTR